MTPARLAGAVGRGRVGEGEEADLRANPVSGGTGERRRVRRARGLRPSCVREQAGVALQRGLASGVGKSWAAGKEGWAVRVAGPAGKERRGSGLGRVRRKELGCWVLGLVLVFLVSSTFSILFPISNTTQTKAI